VSYNVLLRAQSRGKRKVWGGGVAHLRGNRKLDYIGKPPYAQGASVGRLTGITGLSSTTFFPRIPQESGGRNGRNLERGFEKKGKILLGNLQWRESYKEYSWLQKIFPYASIGKAKEETKQQSRKTSKEGFKRREELTRRSATF